MPSRKDRLHGTLDTLVLRTLTFGPRHGYAVHRWIAEHTRYRLEVDDGSLYPALRRMERDGWIEADWGTSELGRRVRVYRITEKGRTHLHAQAREFTTFVDIVRALLLPV
jgi:PadR family transcriptional regulator PadR